MGGRGNREPTALTLLGTGQADQPAPVDPPEWLSPDALDVWQTLAPQTAPGSLTEATAPTFAMLATALATYVEADQLIQSAGLLITAGMDLVPNPALAIRERADATAAKWARLFGLLPDPSGRAKAIGPTGQKTRGLPHLIEGQG